MKFSIKDFSSEFDQIRKILWSRSHLLKKSFMEKFIFRAVKKFGKFEVYSWGKTFQSNI